MLFDILSWKSTVGSGEEIVDGLPRRFQMGHLTAIEVVLQAIFQTNFHCRQGSMYLLECGLIKFKDRLTIICFFFLSP